MQKSNKQPSTENAQPILMTRAQYAEEWDSIYYSWLLEGKSEEAATKYANQSLSNVEISD